MNIKILFALLAVVPGVSFAAVRDGGANRASVRRVAAAGSIRPSSVQTIKVNEGGDPSPTVNTPAEIAVAVTAAAMPAVPNNTISTLSDTPVDAETQSDDITTVTPDVGEQIASGDCRAAYRACMDEFCLLDESEGARCACSDNINQSKDLIQEILSIQEEADKLYTEGVEREKLGAQAKLVFGESEDAKKSSRVSGINFADWIGGTDEDEELGEDLDIGSGLYAMASEYCAAELVSCGAKAEMEEVLYSRQIVSDCKSFDAYLKDQKTNALANKRTAESAVRQARLEMLDTTNKYNRGECLLAYRGCIADKGGCGTNFENCLDADLLGRRANACENVLDQCLAVKSYVMADWAAESEMILADAAKYADRYARQTCMARIQACLEDGCATGTNPACLTDVNVAAGVCPVIGECEAMIPGITATVNSKLGYLRTQFCQNDIDKCLRDKCGANFTAPECVGKTANEIAALCPQDMYPSCATESQFDIIVQAVLLQMDYQLMQGCLNYFGEQLSAVCGTDMSCLPTDTTVAALTTVPDTDAELAELRNTVRANSVAAVDKFFVQFEKDKTVAACTDSVKPAGGNKSLGDSVFNSAKMIAQIGAENRALRALESKIAELSREQDLADAEKNCYALYQVETPDKSSKNYSYIRSVAFEPALRNCHVCRMQQVCESGGESKGSAAMKGAAGGLAAGASAGTMVSAGWGTAIGGIIGAVGGGLMGGLGSEGIKEFCQEIESCEDINM